MPSLREDQENTGLGPVVDKIGILTWSAAAWSKQLLVEAVPGYHQMRNTED